MFYLSANHAETADLSFWDRELSNKVQLVQVRPRIVLVHTFYGVGPGEAEETTLVQELSKAITFFVLGPTLVESYIWIGYARTF